MDHVTTLNPDDLTNRLSRKVVSDLSITQLLAAWSAGDKSALDQ